MDWKMKDGYLTKQLVFKDFLEVISVVNKIATLAENVNHHLDMLIYSYKKLKIMIKTHESKKITDKDYELAEQIDKLIN